MTDQEFQKIVLNFIAEQKKVNERQEGFNEKFMTFIQDQTTFNEKFTTFMQDQTTFNGKFTNFMQDQTTFNEKLFIVVENEIVDKLSGFTDGARAYADTKIEEHEESYQHTPVVV